MRAQEDHDLTALLDAFARGENGAATKVLPLIYDELHRIAHHRRWQWGGMKGPGTTSLVHEAYINLVDRTAGRWENRAHFFYFASVAMRNVLIDAAKRLSRKKRGGDRHETSIDDHTAVSHQRGEELLALDEALERLEKADRRLGRIVECRFFGGLTVEETADALDLSPATVKRGWDTARAWLYKELSGARNGHRPNNGAP